MTAKGEILGSIVVRAMGRNRRVSLTAARPVEGLLSEATAGIQLASSELVFMPQSRLSTAYQPPPYAAKV